ncbi:MAG: hypothetical protein FD139_605 [Methylocystaceae bacterium]|nr:MAG: hypothetical protein FD172_1652 [Methylocystaceae bacterium]TXT47102.1 MAG: hypothetical protein FD139_605 [Methylocystaceae bacterium]
MKAPSNGLTRGRRSPLLLSQPWRQNPFERFRERAFAGIAIVRMAAALKFQREKTSALSGRSSWRLWRAPWLDARRLTGRLQRRRMRLSGKNQSGRKNRLGRRRVQRAIVKNATKSVAMAFIWEKRRLAVHRILRRADRSESDAFSQRNGARARGLREHKQGDERRKNARALTCPLENWIHRGLSGSKHRR